MQLYLQKGCKDPNEFPKWCHESYFQSIDYKSKPLPIIRCKVILQLEHLFLSIGSLWDSRMMLTMMYFFDVSPRKCGVWLLFTGDHLLIAVQKQDGEMESGTQFPTRRLVRVSPPSSLQHLFQLPSYVSDSSEFPLFDSSSRVSADSYLLTFDL